MNGVGQLEGCNQQDFLPFTCPQCSKALCLAHRSPLAHSCSQAGRNDVTSMDCPICGKSIKMNKSDDPNAEWGKHFSTVCTQNPATKKSALSKCVAPSCQVVLGPSNHLICNQCGRKVCLSHRVPEQHNCATIRRTDQLNRISKSSTKNSGKTASAPVTSTGAKVNKSRRSGSSAAADPSNTLRGTAERRRQRLQEQQAAESAPTFSDHHSPVSVQAPGPIDITGNMGAGAESVEPCPICGQRFRDAATLIAHMDTEHASLVNDPAAYQSLPAPTSHVSSSPPAQSAGGGEVSLLLVSPVGSYSTSIVVEERVAAVIVQYFSY
jgi:predicted nucleic acid binding AN1-type Zn finger protein